jgi:hypothetical protein
LWTDVDISILNKLLYRINQLLEVVGVGYFGLKHFT